MAVLGGLGAGVAALWGVTAVVTVVAGRASSVHISAPAALFLALALVGTAVMFLAVGALTSQLASTRRQAAAMASLVLGLSYGLRMVADAGAGLHGLVWASPLGWVEQLHPLTRPQPLALLPMGAFTVVVALLAVVLAGRRDVGSGLWPDRSSRPSRPAGLGGPARLALRLSGPSALSWAVALTAAGLLLGVVARAAGTTIAGSSVQQVFSRLGAPGSGTATFLGVSFVILAMVVAFEATTQVNTARAEEADGRLDNLLAGPTTRARWLGGRILAATVALALSGLTGGAAAWAGAAAEGHGVGLATAVDAGLNIVPPAFFVLGTGVLGLGLWPRRAVALSYAVLAWSALTELVGGLSAQSHWLLDTSLFKQMTSAPAVAPDWQVNGVLVGLGLLAMAVGAVALGRRDLAGA
jgi:ABC-2 type transport system permease protein